MFLTTLASSTQHSHTVKAQSLPPRASYCRGNTRRFTEKHQVRRLASSHIKCLNHDTQLAGDKAKLLSQNGNLPHNKESSEELCCSPICSNILLRWMKSINKMELGETLIPVSCGYHLWQGFYLFPLFVCLSQGYMKKKIYEQIYMKFGGHAWPSVEK